MANCGQACPYNTLNGCKVKENNAICPLTNIATPVTEYRMTNADLIRAMSDEELAKEFSDCAIGLYCDTRKKGLPELPESVKREVFDSLLEWLKQPAEAE